MVNNSEKNRYRKFKSGKNIFLRVKGQNVMTFENQSFLKLMVNNSEKKIDIENLSLVNIYF